MSRLPLSRISTSQEPLPAMFKDIFRRIYTLESRYPGGPKVGAMTVVATAAALPAPHQGLEAYVIATGTLWQVPGAIPMSSLPPLGAWVDTGSPPPP